MKRSIIPILLCLLSTAFSQMQVKNSNQTVLMTVTPSGNVGIGVTNPVYKLSVTGDVYATKHLLTGYQSGTTGGVYITRSTEYGIPAVQSVNASFSGADLAINPAGGKVGIGMVAPRSKLHVWGGAIRTHNYAQMSACSHGYSLYAGNAYLEDPNVFKFAETHESMGAVGLATHYPWGNYTSIIKSPGEGATQDAAFTPTTLVTVTPTGFVGIGTTAPQGILEVTMPLTCGPVTGKYGSIVFGESHFASWPGRYSQWSHNLDYVSANTWRYRADGAGAVIQMGGMGGCVDPVPTEGALNLSIANPGLAGNTTSLTHVLWIKSTGIGVLKVPSDTYALDVNGIIRCTSVSQTSDIRFKTNIRPMKQALAKVESLRGVTYDWRRDEFPQQLFPQGEQLGLIAQEVQSILPEAVQEDEDGYLAVDYAKIVPVLIEAIKEMNQEIRALRAQINP